ncbi:hypothetical protein KKG16_04875, partial [Patescibacteria group bacterium]|nr:hypothetical protein [Patescibacteria group bacterium]
EHPMTSSDLCKVLGIENTSLFTDIYRLMLVRDVDRMNKKGISRPILSKTDDKPAKYILDPEWRMALVRG